MIKHNQDGGSTILIIVLVLVIMLLVAASGFGYWAFMGRQDYKNNTDQKITVAVQAAVQKESAVKDAQFAEASKNPLATYVGPEAYGSIRVSYPKTWSGYVDDSGNGSALVDGYFAPGVVPSLTAQNSVFALRVQVLSQAYSQTLQTLSGYQQSGKLKVSAYALPKVPSVTGIQAIGQINNQANVDMVVLPLRSQTIEIYTQGTSYLSDFNNYILPNFSFSP